MSMSCDSAGTHPLRSLVKVLCGFECATAVIETGRGTAPHRRGSAGKHSATGTTPGGASGGGKQGVDAGLPAAPKFTVPRACLSLFQHVLDVSVHR